jgi:hypothetical protein
MMEQAVLQAMDISHAGRDISKTGSDMMVEQGVK